MGIAENKRIIPSLSRSCRGKENLTARLLGPLFSRSKSGLIGTIDNVVAEADLVVVQPRGQAETTAGTKAA